MGWGEVVQSTKATAIWAVPSIYKENCDLPPHFRIFTWFLIAFRKKSNHTHGPPCSDLSLISPLHPPASVHTQILAVPLTLLWPGTCVRAASSSSSLAHPPLDVIWSVKWLTTSLFFPQYITLPCHSAALPLPDINYTVFHLHLFFFLIPWGQRQYIFFNLFNAQ